MYQIMLIFASITYYFLLYTEQCEQWFNIIQIDTNKKEKRKDTQYYLKFFPTPPPTPFILSVLITYLWISESQG